MANGIGSTADRDENDLSTVSEKVARFFGVVFILLGLFLIIFLVGGFIISKLPYRVDPNLPIPTLSDTDEYSNKDSVDLSGTVLPGEDVILYVDGDRTDQVVATDEDGRFSFENVPLEEEGETTFEASVVRGGLFKRRSEFSNLLSMNVDWTPPSTSISLEYTSETTLDTTTVSGTAEPNSVVVFENELGTYEAEVNEEGSFKRTDLPLSTGINAFTVRIKDKAGNEVIATETVEVAYVADAGDVNGAAATTGPTGTGSVLPESAGELEAALEYIAGNRAMLIIALVSIAIFSLNSAVVLKKTRQLS